MNCIDTILVLNVHFVSRCCLLFFSIDRQTQTHMHGIDKEQCGFLRVHPYSIFGCTWWWVLASLFFQQAVSRSTRLALEDLPQNTRYGVLAAVMATLIGLALVMGVVMSARRHVTTSRLTYFTFTFFYLLSLCSITIFFEEVSRDHSQSSLSTQVRIDWSVFASCVFFSLCIDALLRHRCEPFLSSMLAADDSE